MRIPDYSWALASTIPERKKIYRSVLKDLTLLLKCSNCSRKVDVDACEEGVYAPRDWSMSFFYDEEGESSWHIYCPKCTEKLRWGLEGA